MTFALNTVAQGLFLLPLAVIFIINLFPRRTAHRLFFPIGLAVAVLQGVGAAAGGIILWQSRQTRFDFNVFVSGKNAGDNFSARRMTFFLMLCIAVVVFVSVMIAKKTITTKKRAYLNLLMSLLFGMNGMLLTTDLFTLYVFLEIVGISSFVLIAMFRSRTGLEGSFKYLVLSSVGVMLLLTGLSFLFMQTGSLGYTDILIHTFNLNSNTEKALTYAAIILIISGFCVKAGAVPFHSWLPDAHQSADTAVSVLLSGIVIKIAGIYGLVVVWQIFGRLNVVRLIFGVIGIISIVYGALLASRQDHFKRICAYSSVSQMGYIILALSTNTVLGLIGALAHILSHALFKSTLFTNAAALHEQTGTLDIKEMGGLEKKMPVTSFSSVIAFLSTAGIPPMSGFWSKLLIILALWQCGNEPAAAAALIASIFTSVYFLRLQKNVFFGKTPVQLDGVEEIGGTVKLVEILLTAATIGVGLAFPFLLAFLQNAGYIM